MKFEWKHGLIWVEMDLVYEGTTIKIDNCIIDTGSSTTAIDIEFGDIKKALGINGFIGNDILSKFIVNIDFNQRVIDLKL